MELRDAPVIVTGGGSGLGAATARVLSVLGARVTVLDVNDEAARAVAEKIGGRWQACDVSDPISGAAAVAAATAAHGPARVLVNCAGVAPAARIVGRDGPMKLEAFSRVVGINLIGTFNMLRLAAAEMAAQEPDEGGERGVVVNTASIAGYEGQVGQAAYAASKAGVIGLTLPAARELARSGIRVVTIAPGLMETPMMAGLPQDVQDSLGASVPFPPRLGRPEEFASLVVHICVNRMINGETIRLDGALRMGPR